MSRNAELRVMRSGLWTTLPPGHQVFPASRGPSSMEAHGASRGRGCYFERCFSCCCSTTSQDGHRGRAAIAKSGGPSHRRPGRWSRPRWWRLSSVCCLQTDCRERGDRAKHVISSVISINTNSSEWGLQRHFDFAKSAFCKYTTTKDNTAAGESHTLISPALF